MSRLAAVFGLALTAALAACSDTTAPKDPAKERAATTEQPSSRLAPSVPSLVTFSTATGSVGKFSVPYQPVACGSVPSIALRTVSVKGPTVLAAFSVAPYFVSEYAIVETTLRKVVNGAWVNYDRRATRVNLPLNYYSPTTAQTADFGLVGPGTYYAWTHITWYGVAAGMLTTYKLGDQWVTYNQNADYSITGSVVVSGGACSIW